MGCQTSVAYMPLGAVSQWWALLTGTDRRVVRTGWCAKTPSDQRHPETNQGPLSSNQGAGFVSNRTTGMTRC